MVEIGRTNKLPVLRRCDFGLVLDGGGLGEILLPNREAAGIGPDEKALSVFVYLDSENRLVATLMTPKVKVGGFALLRVKEVAKVGAFLDWGLPKDLLAPFREQRVPMKEGQSYLVHVYLDRVSNRIVASSKLDKFLDGSRRAFKTGEKVELIVWQRTDLGYKAIIDQECWGMLFSNEVYQPLDRGQKLDGFIKRVRTDGLIDLALHQPGYGKVTELTDVILTHLRDAGGFAPLTDQTPPEQINALFGVSKKTYKKAVGALYRQRQIMVEPDGIRLVETKAGRKKR